MVHHIKSWPRFFERNLAGEKTFEVRLNDRDYKVGDYLHLQEWNPDTAEYTGREKTYYVPYILGAEMHCAVSPVAINKPYIILSIVEKGSDE